MAAGGEAPKLLMPTEFEKHAGMGAAKKWKGSIRLIEPGLERMPIGRWLDTCAVSGGGAALAGMVPREITQLDFDPVVVAWAVDRCAVCDDDRDFEWDQLVTCEGCQARRRRGLGLPRGWGWGWGHVRPPARPASPPAPPC